MNAQTKIIRELDGKIFHPTFIAHWTDIQSEDGETDCIKCYGGNPKYDLYVSANKGFGYFAERNQ